MKTIKVHFLGASNCVTGSKFFIETPELNLMIDCGMFQGNKKLREINWKDLPINVQSIDYVLLTHGHLDHCGYLPRLVKQGFKGEILGTAPTLSITEIVLTDSAKIHEEEAEKANKEGYSKHHPAKAFYTQRDVEKTIPLLKSIDKDEWIQLSENIQVRFKYNGHIIGATFIEIDIYEKRYVFSGDIGRNDDVLLFAPEKPTKADYLFLESTYGNKQHPKDVIDEKLVTLINRTIANKGTLIIPSFAIERLQVIMYLFWKLYNEYRMTNIPVYIDSPMGNKVISVFKKFADWHKLDETELNSVLNFIRVNQGFEDTWNTIDSPNPKIIISASGMLSGGRVLTYLKQLIDEPNTTVLLVGYQAEGTRGRKLLEGATEMKIYGKHYPVKASIEHIESLSAHADSTELITWMNSLSYAPEKVFLIHGEQEAQLALKNNIESIYKCVTYIPQLYDIETF